MKIWAVLLAAGKSSRLQNQGSVLKKQFMSYNGVPVFWHSVMTFARSAKVRGVIIAFPAEELKLCMTEVERLIDTHDPGIPVLGVSGGLLRQDSVLRALRSLPADCTHVLVHDAARPFFSAGLIHSLIQAISNDWHGIVPGIACTDTIKEKDHDLVVRTLPRERLIAVQTPQFFNKEVLIKAHVEAGKQSFTATDDASMLELLDYKVRAIPGEERNIKITTAEDLRLLAEEKKPACPCTGFGYDVHRYGGSRPMILGGQPIPGAPGVYAHSDGDVLIHALVDAILGCLGRGDIGEFFPDSDPANENLSSTVFLSEVLSLARSERLELTHIDITLVAQIPKLSPHKKSIASNLAGLTGLDPGRINIKATTEEGLGFTGAKQGIKAMAVVSALRHEN